MNNNNGCIVNIMDKVNVSNLVDRQTLVD